MAKKVRKPKTNVRSLMNEYKYGTKDPKVIIELETKDDEKFFRDSKLHWDDIEALDKNLVFQSTKLANELLPIAENQEIIDNLGDRKELFIQAFRTFKEDFHKFLLELEKIQAKWEGKYGPIRDMDSFSLYNLVASEYNDVNLRFVSLAQLSSSTITVEAMQAVQRSKDNENNIEEGVFTEINEDLKKAQDGTLFDESEETEEVKEKLDA